MDANLMLNMTEIVMEGVCTMMVMYCIAQVLIALIRGE